MYFYIIINIKKQLKTQFNTPMENLIQFAGTNNSPKVLFDLENGTLEMSGRAFAEHPLPLFESLTENMKKVKTCKLDVTMKFDYVNTSSSKCLLNLLKTAKATVSDVSVNWISEEDDEDNEELGKLFEDCTGLPFKFQTSL